MKKDSKGNLYLDIDDILNVIGDLSKSQGFYGRLQRDLIELRNNDADAWQDVVDNLEAQHFKTTLDVVFFFEC